MTLLQAIVITERVCGFPPAPRQIARLNLLFHLGKLLAPPCWSVAILDCWRALRGGGIARASVPCIDADSKSIFLILR